MNDLQHLFKIKHNDDGTVFVPTEPRLERATKLFGSIHMPNGNITNVGTCDNHDQALEFLMRSETRRKEGKIPFIFRFCGTKKIHVHEKDDSELKKIILKKMVDIGDLIITCDAGNMTITTIMSEYEIQNDVIVFDQRSYVQLHGLANNNAKAIKDRNSLAMATLGQFIPQVAKDMLCEFLDAMIAQQAFVEKPPKLLPRRRGEPMPTPKKYREIIFIDPEATRTRYVGRGDGGATYPIAKSPHARRGHIRTLESGKRVAVRPCWVGPREVMDEKKRVYEILG